MYAEKYRLDGRIAVGVRFALGGTGLVGSGLAAFDRRAEPMRCGWWSQRLPVAPTPKQFVG